jgi:hypothetical protein
MVGEQSENAPHWPVFGEVDSTESIIFEVDISRAFTHFVGGLLLFLTVDK